MADVLNIFIRSVFGHLQRRARELLGLKQTQCGAVTFVQRFNSGLGLNTHFHCVAIDGIYSAAADGSPEFYKLPPPEDEEVLLVTTDIAARVLSLIERRGLENEADPLSEDDPGLSALYAAAVQGRIANGHNAGNRVSTFGGGDRIDADSLEAMSSPRCAAVSGFNLHANVAINARDRDRIERLLRYAARPALALDRLSKLPNGRLVYNLKRTWSNGATDVIFEPQDFIAKLAALVPPPRVHLTRFHGLLGPAAKWRSQIIPKPIEPVATSIATPISAIASTEALPSKTEPEAANDQRPQKRNYSWAQLMMRVFRLDVLACECCGGRLRIIAAIHPPDTTRKILDCLGLPNRAPPLSPAVLEPSYGF